MEVQSYPIIYNKCFLQICFMPLLCEHGMFGGLLGKSANRGELVKNKIHRMLTPPQFSILPVIE